MAKGEVWGWMGVLYGTGKVRMWEREGCGTTKVFELGPVRAMVLRDAAHAERLYFAADRAS